MNKGIMMKANVPSMVPLQITQLEWIQWMFTQGDGLQFLHWTGMSEEMKLALVDIMTDREYDGANDSDILNDMRGLYRKSCRRFR